MKSTLLFGNGFNRLNNKNISWEELIQRATGSIGEGDMSNIPLPILAEAYASKAGNMIGGRTKDSYKEFKTMIKNSIDEARLQPDATHCLFRSLPFDYFITTNYDDCFERSKDGYEESFKNSGGYRYLTKKIGDLEGRPIFHAHGHQKWANTICVNYEHYMGLIGKLREELYPSEVSEDNRLDILKSLVKDERKAKNNWAELFFLTDVYIVGLGLNYSESDLWWLLALRAALFSPNNGLDECANNIHYFVIDTNQSNDQNKDQSKNQSKDQNKDSQKEDRGKYAALEYLGVQVRHIKAKKYKEGYEKIAGEIEKQIEQSTSS